MYIIYLCNELPPGNTGGIGIFVSGLTKRLALRGHKVFIIGFLDDVKVKKTADINGATVIKLPYRKGLLGQVLNKIRLYREIKFICSKFPVDIIEAPDFEGLAAFLPKGRHKLIVRLHGSHTYFADEMNEPPSFLIKTLERISLIKADVLVSVSRYTADRTNHIFGINRGIQVIYNGIDLPDIQQCKSAWKEGSKVVFTGTLMKKKGVFSIAESWPIVKKEIPHAELIMIGKDTIVGGQSAKDKIQQISGDMDIVFLGHLPKNEMENVVVKCDVAVYPSYSETFGLAPIEAMALKVPTIYTKSSCGPEVVKIKKLIDICVHPDNPIEIANNLIKLLSNENLRREVANLGRSLVEDTYSNDSKVFENEELYRKAIENA